MTGVFSSASKEIHWERLTLHHRLGSQQLSRCKTSCLQARPGRAQTPPPQPACHESGVFRSDQPVAASPTSRDICIDPLATQSGSCPDLIPPRQWDLVRQILRPLPCLPLVLAAYLVAMAGSTVATGHRAASLRRAIATWTIPGPMRGSAAPDTPITQQRRLPRQRRSGVTTGARRAGPREHGRQAARSKRDRPERTRKPHNGPSHVRAAAGGALETI